ncbi:hypothetical protein QNI16_34885 [Cytophagaceae bacterium YF14B1]|uniref:Chloroplast import component protein (Tic20) n=1 Tax=Xanthocytophaga flava TaxID=3048013 RepID=A0AAE3UDE6_9BACT|nr:hypothetical protein [Xanthocytophaga flavus]MDJ1485719.1 hypothetical protein [Xanthocytophaga flavus]
MVTFYLDYHKHLKAQQFGKLLTYRILPNILCKNITVNSSKLYPLIIFKKMEEQPGHQIVPVTDDGKTIAIISYLTLVGFIIALIMHSSNKTSLGAFHLRQVLLLIIIGIAVSFIAWIPILGQLVWLVTWLGLFVFWILGLISAINGEEKPMPLIGVKAQEMFATVFK